MISEGNSQIWGWIDLILNVSLSWLHPLHSGRPQSMILHPLHTVRFVSASLRNEIVEGRGLGTRSGRVHMSVKMEQEERRPPPQG